MSVSSFLSAPKCSFLVLVLILSLTEPYRYNPLGTAVGNLSLCWRCGVRGRRASAFNQMDLVLLPVLPSRVWPWAIVALHGKYRAGGIYPQDCLLWRLCEIIHTHTPTVLYYGLMQIMYPPIWEGNLYPVYFHVLCDESSERHWGKYDDISLLSQSLFQILDSIWTYHVFHVLEGVQGTFQSVCLSAFDGSCHWWSRGRERRYRNNSLPVRGALLCQFPACWAPRNIGCPSS